MNAHVIPPDLNFASTADPDPALHGFWEEAMHTRAFRQLIALKMRTVGPLLAVSFIFILGMSLLVGYDKPLMGAKVFGPVNVGYLLVFLTYLLCWVVSVVYVRIANARFDPQARAAAATVSRGAQG